MNNPQTSRKAIVTLALGDRYLQHWKTTCEANWRAYGAKHGFDVICLDQPLDDSTRARGRSASWQKCLVLGQDFSSNYERIVWIDTDILINLQAAPAIDAGLPPDKIGAAEEFSYSKNEGRYPQLALERGYAHWKNPIVNYRPQEFYTNYGLPNGFETVVQAGVMVLSPRHHRALLEKIYYNYEEKGGPEWNYEMRPLSYELLKADAVQWIDPRFNLMWVYLQLLYYPFLLNRKVDQSLAGRIRRKLAALMDAPSFTTTQRACLTTAFLNSFFFHCGGGSLEELTLIDQNAVSIVDCSL